MQYPRYCRREDYLTRWQEVTYRRLDMTSAPPQEKKQDYLNGFGSSFPPCKKKSNNADMLQMCTQTSEVEHKTKQHGVVGGQLSLECITSHPSLYCKDNVQGALQLLASKSNSRSIFKRHHMQLNHSTNSLLEEELLSGMYHLPSKLRASYKSL